MNRYEGDVLSPSSNRQRILSRFREFLLEVSGEIREVSTAIGTGSGPVVIREVCEGFICSVVCVPAHDYDALTPRERQVSALVQRGFANKAIAVELAMSPTTVAAHMRSIFKKLRICSRNELIVGSAPVAGPRMGKLEV
jgi:DNA-binding CsgD family transcriptional regulator